MEMYRPLGYQQIVGAVAATALTVPENAVFALIQVESKDCRWRDDGTVPTAAVGQLLFAGNDMVYSANLRAIRFIQTAATATINVHYYGH